MSSQHATHSHSLTTHSHLSPPLPPARPSLPLAVASQLFIQMLGLCVKVLEAIKAIGESASLAAALTVRRR